MNILIVEDERCLADEVAAYLRNENLLCEIASTGAEASEKLAVNLYDFVLLDLGLPDYNGLDLINEAKKNNLDVSFIILTARGDIEDRVKGLDLGADDYLAKPFAFTELYSRIMAVARRKFHINNMNIVLGDFTVEIQARRIFCNNEEVELTRKEFDLLLYLIINRNRVLTRLQLYEHIWGNILDDQYDSNFIDVHIKNIRKKLHEHSHTEWLETVYGVGYKVKAD